jgi:taurine dioxygenase
MPRTVMEFKHYSPQEALHQHRHIDIRLRLDRSIIDVSDQDIWLLLELLARHGVLCLVNQPPITPRQLHEFAARWGEVIELPASLALANQEPRLRSITRVGNIRPDGTIISDVRFAEYWHHDGDFWPAGENFIVNFLSSVQIPPIGGHTGLLDSRAAYEKLPDRQKAALADAYICVRAREIADFKMAAPHELPPDVQHPVLFRHPLTNQIALYLPDSSTGIQNTDGHVLGTVQSVIDALQNDLEVVEHVWADGDLLIIDNLQIMHRSMGGYGNRPRLLYRCQARIAEPKSAPG